MNRRNFLKFLGITPVVPSLLLKKEELELDEKMQELPPVDITLDQSAQTHYLTAQDMSFIVKKFNPTIFK